MKKVFALMALALASTFSNANDEPSLLLEGSYESLIALRDTFFIEYSDQVSDGCLPQPSRMKDKMELALRQNGFSVAADDSFLQNKVKITALGFSTNSSSCAVHISADLVFWAGVVVPYAQNVPSGPNTIVPITFHIGDVILTGAKNNMQERIEKQIKEFGEDLYLGISRSKDEVKKKFPQILEHHAQQQNKNQ